uniref:Uncharacterized protein n=1 Tax=Bosea sp. NBC_00436 TaxID=2969620 RepID=A0A9E7ZQF0_9HYPH
MADISIDDSVGIGGANLPGDVAKITAALLAIGPNRGGLATAPTSLDALGKAIKAFQTRQVLPVRDGRVDKVGNTIRRINLLLGAPGPSPKPTPPGNTGEIRPIPDIGTLKREIEQNSWSPVQSSLRSEMLFGWTGVRGKGKLFYFELDETVVPRWFGVLVPDGEVDFSKIHVFFHPLPGQAGYNDATYHNRGAFFGIFRYLGGDRIDLAVQFCAANTGRVLIMPLFTNQVGSTCGVLPARWEDLFGRILAMTKSGGADGANSPVAITDMIVSSFSNGISYSHAFRSRAGLRERLAGVIDFDGAISTSGHLSAQIVTPPGRVARMQQMFAVEKALPDLAVRGIFPLPSPRWLSDTSPFKTILPKTPQAALLAVHPLIAQHMMFTASRYLA